MTEKQPVTYGDIGIVGRIVTSNEPRTCTFCFETGKHLVMGPHPTTICHSCIEIAMDILATETPPEIGDKFKCAPKWQPIETAPKDGTRILVVNEKEIVIAYASDSVWVDKKKGELLGWCIFDCHSDTESIFPTHWMPLPNHQQKQVSHEKV